MNVAIDDTAKFSLPVTSTVFAGSDGPSSTGADCRRSDAYGDGRSLLFRGGRSFVAGCPLGGFLGNQVNFRRATSRRRRAKPIRRTVADCRRAVRRLFKSRIAWGRLIARLCGRKLVVGSGRIVTIIVGSPIL